MLRAILILLLVFGVTAAILWTAVHTLRKVLHIKESGLDPAGEAPAAGSPYAAEEARRARWVRGFILGGIAAIGALLAMP
jgi:hypothetical protein